MIESLFFIARLSRVDDEEDNARRLNENTNADFNESKDEVVSRVNNECRR